MANEENKTLIEKSTLLNSNHKRKYKNYDPLIWTLDQNPITNAKLLSDKLPSNLGYLYENLMAQMIVASGRELYYHTWKKKDSTHYYEVDFLISEGSKINAFEIKSSGTGKHESITEFSRKFSKNVKNIYLMSQKDIGKEENLQLKPFYLMPFLI